MKIHLPQVAPVTGPRTAAWPGAPEHTLEDTPQAITAWLDQRRQQYPDDPYCAGACLMRTIWPHDFPDAGTPRIQITCATPHTLINDEALASAYRRHTSPDVTLVWQAHLDYDGHTEVAADLEHRRLHGAAAHRAVCDHTPPYRRPDHEAHQCGPADVCWWGWLLKIEATNQTTIYRITDYDHEHNGWRAQWID